MLTIALSPVLITKPTIDKKTGIALAVGTGLLGGSTIAWVYYSKHKPVVLPLGNPAEPKPEISKLLVDNTNLKAKQQIALQTALLAGLGSALGIGSFVYLLLDAYAIEKPQQVPNMAGDAKLGPYLDLKREIIIPKLFECEALIYEKITIGIQPFIARIDSPEALSDKDLNKIVDDLTTLHDNTINQIFYFFHDITDAQTLHETGDPLLQERLNRVGPRDLIELLKESIKKAKLRRNHN